MECKYLVKLPDGREIIIPANLNTLSEGNDVLKELITDYYKSPNTENRGLIREYLKKIKVKVDSDLLRIVLENSTVDTFINNFNKRILQEGSIDSLESAIWKWAYSNKDVKTSENKKIKFDSAFKAISQDIDRKYLNVQNILQVIGKKSAFDERQDLKIKIDELSESGIGYDVENAVYNLLKVFNTKEMFRKQIFYPISTLENENDTLVIIDKETNNPLIFYKNGNPLSLFLGLFKYSGLSLNVAELQPIIEAHNKSAQKNENNQIDPNVTIEDFFIGGFLESGEFKEAEIHKLFRYTATANTTINTILDLLNVKTPEIWTKSLVKDAKELMVMLDPKKYGKKIFGFSEEAVQLYNKDRTKNKELVNNLRSRKYIKMLEKESRSFHYSQTKGITFGSEELTKNIVETPSNKVRVTEKPLEDAYNFIKNNIELGKDALMFPIGEFGTWGIPVNVKIDRYGLKVERLVEENGIIETKWFTFKGDSIEIKYKKFESEGTKTVHKIDAQPITENKVIILPENSGDTIDPEIAKVSLVRGATVKRRGKNGQIYTSIVNAVYPGGVWLKGANYEVGFDKFTQIITSYDTFEDQEFTDSNDEKFQYLKNYNSIDANFYIQPGNIIVYTEKGKKRINRVIGSTEKSVYILIKTIDADSKESKHHIKSIPRNLVVKTYFEPIPIDYKNLIEAAKFSIAVTEDNSISSSNYSYFTSYEMASNGDYVILDDSIYQIVDKENNIVGQATANNTLSIEQLKTLSSATTFLTSRDISSDYAIDIIEINNPHILPDKFTNTETEAVYLIKKGESLSSSVLLNSNNFNIGTVAQKSHYYNEDGTPKETLIKDQKEKGFVDVTNEALKIINESRGTNHQKLTIDNKNGYFVRYNKNYKQFDFSSDKYFPEVKRNSLKPGTVIVFKGNDGLSGRKHYRVLSRSENFVTLEYVTFSNSGKIVSIVKELPVDQIMDKIKWFYALYGSNVVSELESPKSNPENYTSRLELLSTVAERARVVFNIPVEITTTSNMKNNQKAKIESTPEYDQNGKLVNTNDKIILNLNNEKSNEYDLVHEYLHLFLIAMKYKDKLGVYEKLLFDYKTWKLKNGTDFQISKINDVIDPSLLEEFFVEDIVKFLQSKNDLPVDNYEVFRDSFTEAISTFDIDQNILSEIESTENPMVILNKRIGDIFKVKSNPMYKSGLITFESNFRKWLSDNIEKNEITVICK